MMDIVKINRHELTFAALPSSWLMAVNLLCREAANALSFQNGVDACHFSAKYSSIDWCPVYLTPKPLQNGEEASGTFRAYTDSTQATIGESSGLRGDDDPIRRAVGAGKMVHRLTRINTDKDRENPFNQRSSAYQNHWPTT